jgi:tetratricopeptide (TPR) repeat protein
MQTVPNGPGDGAEAPARLGRYELGRPLGTGGMGIVFEARDGLLDRAVAIKLLKPGAFRPASEVLLREAKALARLVHPNVVTVFDVGVTGDDIFVAMELVDGVTLRDWMEQPHDWRAVIDVFVAAGRGLAAVHALGLVHRDFKPSNVLLDRAGTPKVGDFGLVCATGEDADGASMGTPGYMSPEQGRGAPVDARTDQYAFAIALDEALRGAGPARLRPILARARSASPAGRYPSMDALIAALLHARRGPQRWWLAAGATSTLIATVAITLSVGQAAPEDPCPAPDAELAPIWGEARKAALDAHVRAVDPAQGATRLGVITGAFDPFARAWRAQRISACRATRVTGKQSDALLDRRVACLDRALAELGETVGAIERAPDPAGLDAALHAVVALPSLDACADTAALAERVPPPTGAAARAEHDAIARALAAIDVTRRVEGQLAGLEDRAAALVARARRLDHPGILADALVSLAEIQLEHEEDPAALATLDEAIQLGAAAHDDRLVATAWLRKVGIVDGRMKRLDDGDALLPAATAAVTRAGDRADQRFALGLLRSQLAMLRGDFDRARALLAEAGHGLDQAPGEFPAQRARAAEQAASIEAKAGNWARAADLYRAHIALVVAQLGADHPDIIRSTFNLGICLRMLHQDDAALVANRDAVRIGLARLAPSPSLASLVGGLASTLTQLGHNDEARPYAERALAMARATMPARDPRLAEPLGQLGQALMNLGDYAAARPLIVEELGLRDRDDKPTTSHASALNNLATIELSTSHCAAAIAPATRAVAMYEAVGGKDSADLSYPLSILGDCAMQAHRWPEAIAATARVVALTSSEVEPIEHMLGQWLHGRSLVESGRDRAVGLREVRAARAAMAASAYDATTLAQVDAWLAAHR